MFCGCCRGWDDSEPTARTPLLGEDPSKPISRQPVSVRGGEGGTRGGVTEEHTGPVKLGKLTMKATKVSHVDKRLQDHAALFNNHYDKFLDIQTYMEELEGAFTSDSADQSLERTMRLIRDRAQTSLNLQRKHEFCLRVEYDDRWVSGEVLPLLRTFNKVNKLVREVVDRSGPIVQSVRLVLQDERELRRDVLASSLGMDGPQCMKHCLQGIEALRQVPSLLERIDRQTKDTYRELVRASEVLCCAEKDRTDVNENVNT